MAFCQRKPQACGHDARDVLQQVAKARAERAELFGQATRMSVSYLPSRPRPAAADVALTMTPSLWAGLKRVNAKVNHAVRPVSDRVHYGLEDYWAEPLEDGGRRGDCEDYVLEKIRALTAAGFPRAALNIAFATTPAGEDHAVLAVMTDEGDLILDSLTDGIRRWDATGYRFQSRQIGGDPFTWVRVRQPRPGSGRVQVSRTRGDEQLVSGETSDVRPAAAVQPRIAARSGARG